MSHDTHSPTSTPTLSVVIVTRNESGRVRGCVESVLDLTAPHDAEVVLVDSNSTDGTVDAATDYPITVLRIPSDDLSSPAAGRHVGFRRARGDLVLFADGDMHLEGGWLADAIRTVRGRADVAGVDGLLGDRDGEPGAGDVTEAAYLRGLALYDATALDAVGGFDPGLDALEDVDLGYRLRRAGYRLLRLPDAVASHPHSSGVGERLRRWQSGYYRANGQVLRKSLVDPGMAARWLYRFRLPSAAAGWGLLGGLLAATRRTDRLAAWLVATGLGVAAVAAARGPGWTTQKAVSYVLFPAGTALGFWRYDGATADYPFDRVEAVQVAEPERR